MPATLPATMQAAAIDRFGDPDELKIQTLPLPELGDGQILLRVEAAGVGVWDPMEAKGYFEKYGKPATFPYIVGFDGAGTVAAVGSAVNRFAVGERVWAWSFLNPKGGLYAEYAAVDADDVSHLPDKLTIDQAGGLGVIAFTALIGLDDTLGLTSGQSVLIHGASGGVGHVAVQFAKRMNLRVLAVASGADGVALCKDLGADEAVDGKTADLAAVARAFAPDGLDAALVLANPEPLADALSALKDGGTIAYPTGVVPAPEPPRDAVAVKEFSAVSVTRATFQTLEQLIAAGPFTVHVAKTFPLARAAEAWKMLDEHFLGKLVLTA